MLEAKWYLDIVNHLNEYHRYKDDVEMIAKKDQSGQPLSISEMLFLLSIARKNDLYEAGFSDERMKEIMLTMNQHVCMTERAGSRASGQADYLLLQFDLSDMLMEHRYSFVVTYKGELLDTFVYWVLL